MLSDAFDDGRGFAGVVDLRERRIVPYQAIDIADVDEAVTVGARHFWVHLGDDMAGGIHGGAGDIDAGAEGAITVFIGRRDLDQRHVDGQQAAFEELRDLAEEDGYIVPVQAVDDVPGGFADEERVHEEAFAPFGVVEVEVSHGGDADELDMMKIFMTGLQGLYQMDGGGGAAMDEDAVAAFHFFYHFSGGFIDGSKHWY